MWIGKKLKKKRREVHGKFVGSMKDGCGRLGIRLRLKERIDKANSWAAAHPKRTAAFTIGALVLSLLMNFLITAVAPQTNEPKLDDIADVQQMFDGMRQIQQGKTAHQSIVAGYVVEGQVLRREVDSLRRLPVKSHEDSVRIVSCYKRLEKLVENLKTQ